MYHTAAESMRDVTL